MSACESCGAAIEPAVLVVVQTPLGVTTFRACAGPCEALVVQACAEQPARRVTEGLSDVDRKRAALGTP